MIQINNICMIYIDSGRTDETGILMYQERKEFQGTWVLWIEQYWVSCAKISLTWGGWCGWRNMIWILDSSSTSLPTYLLKIISWSRSTRTYYLKMDSPIPLNERSVKTTERDYLLCYFFFGGKLLLQRYLIVAITHVIR